MDEFNAALRTTIGDLTVAVLTLRAQLAEAQREIARLKAEPEQSKARRPKAVTPVPDPPLGAPGP
jgi:hypothetical protein